MGSSTFLETSVFINWYIDFCLCLQNPSGLWPKGEAKGEAKEAKVKNKTNFFMNVRSSNKKKLDTTP